MVDRINTLNFSLCFIVVVAFVYVKGVFLTASSMETIKPGDVGYVAVRGLEVHTRLDRSFVKRVPDVIPMGYFGILPNLSDEIVGRYTTAKVSVGQKIDPLQLSDMPQLSIAEINASILLPLTEVLDPQYVNAGAGVLLKLADNSVVPATVLTTICARATIAPTEKKSGAKDISCNAVIQVPIDKVDNLRKQKGIEFSLVSLPKS